MFSITNNCYHRHTQDSIKEAYHTAAGESMLKVAKSFHSNSETPNQKRVTVDGTWQTRGYSSLNGVVTTIIDKKFIDVEVLSKFCHGCVSRENKKSTPEYVEWFANHQCTIYLVGSSGAMESAGAVKIFNRSIEKNNLIYNEYLGDGDTSSFKDVIESNPYKDLNIKITKLECIGHVQKRMGTRLR